MENVCRECGRKFLSDLRFCPHCGGDAVPPKTKAWHYRAPGMIAHTNPIEEQETLAYKQNGWVLLCLGILLVPMWLLGLDLLMDDLTSGVPYKPFIVIFVAASVVLALVFLAASFAFQARRPGTQVMAALLIVVTLNAWNPLVWGLMVGLFIVFLRLWATGGGSRSPSDPTYLPVMSGLAILSVILVFTWTLGSTMGMPF